MNIQRGSELPVGHENGRNNGGLVVPPAEPVRRNGLGDFAFDSRADSALGSPANSLFDAIDPEHFLRMRQFVKRVNLAKDQYLYQQDDEIDLIYFPETSVVSEFQILEDGRTIEVGLVGNDGGVGIPAAFNPYRAANCTQVCVAGSAVVVGREVLQREVMSDPRPRATLHNYINGQIKQLSQRVVCNTFHSVEQRFCSWLLTLNKRSRRDNFKLTHEHLARVLGVHRPSITCIAQVLREKKLIDYGRARLVLRSQSGLERVACRCWVDVQGVQTDAVRFDRQARSVVDKPEALVFSYTDKARLTA
jgi:CRP-like cAMP-binding protein